MSIYQDCLVVHSSYSPKTVRIVVLLDFLFAHLHYLKALPQSYISVIERAGDIRLRTLTHPG